MAAISVRDLDESVREKLRVRAARNGRSMEAEIRAILTDAVADPLTERGLGHALLSEFAAIGGVDLPPVDRAASRPRAADFSRDDPA